MDRRGYPRAKVRGRWVHAHRIAYEAANGPLAEGERVYRTCGDRLCTNPLHLTTRPTQRRGHLHGSAKLNRRQVRTIRRHWAREDRPTQRVLAERYGVHRSTISLIVRGRTWAA